MRLVQSRQNNGNEQKLLPGEASEQALIVILKKQNAQDEIDDHMRQLVKIQDVHLGQCLARKRGRQPD